MTYHNIAPQGADIDAVIINISNLELKGLMGVGLTEILTKINRAERKIRKIKNLVLITVLMVIQNPEIPMATGVVIAR